MGVSSPSRACASFGRRAVSTCIAPAPQVAQTAARAGCRTRAPHGVSATGALAVLLDDRKIPSREALARAISAARPHPEHCASAGRSRS